MWRNAEDLANSSDSNYTNDIQNIGTVAFHCGSDYSLLVPGDVYIAELYVDNSQLNLTNNVSATPNGNIPAGNDGFYESVYITPKSGNTFLLTPTLVETETTSNGIRFTLQSSSDMGYLVAGIV